MTDSTPLIDGLTRAWRDEMASSLNYRALAQREADAQRRALLERLAEAEERHAATWSSRLRGLGVEPGAYRESLAERWRRWTLLQGDTETAVTKLEILEAGADSLYEQLQQITTDDALRAELAAAQREEEAHSRVLGDWLGAGLPVRRRLERLLSAEKWHVSAGGWIGQAIYGVNDGLGAAFGVVSGVAGATSINGQFVLLSGLATAIASALSMGSGAYLASKSEREVYEAELERERAEIEATPEQEREEMELFYQLKGFSAEESRALATRLAEHPDQLLKALAHEELGLSERSFPRPWRAAASATLSTALGASIPVLPFFVTSGTTALVASFVLSTVAHFVVGAVKVIVTGRSWLKSGTEMTLIGLGEAFATYALGLLIAPALS